MVETYCNYLSQIIKNNGFKMDSPEYKTLSDLITQDVLEEAYLEHENIKKLFPKEMDLILRKPKKMERIKKKHPKYFTHLKKNCDFVAFRLPSKCDQIDSNIDLVSKIIKENGGQFIVRDQKKDIVNYLYAYFPNKFIVEFQIGHPFALWTFAQDSLIRDLKDNNITDNLPADLWDNDQDGKCIYLEIKNYLLDPEDYKYDYQKALNDLFKGSIPDSLRDASNYI